MNMVAGTAIQLQKGNQGDRGASWETRGFCQLKGRAEIQEWAGYLG